MVDGESGLEPLEERRRQRLVGLELGVTNLLRRARIVQNGRCDLCVVFSPFAALWRSTGL
jgi:hypothetical protein